MKEATKTQKATYCVFPLYDIVCSISFIWNGKGKTIGTVIVVQWLPVAKGKGAPGNLLGDGNVISCFTWLYTFVETHQTGYLKRDTCYI